MVFTFVFPKLYIMKRLVIFFFSMFTVFAVSAQTASDAINPDKQTLRERYLLLKTKSQNYQEYKVIKENLLDAWWKIVVDSLQAKQVAILQSQANANKLQ